MATKKRLSTSGVKDGCHLVLLRRLGRPFCLRALTRSLAMGHFSRHLHAAPHMFRLEVKLCVRIPAPVARPRPRVDDNYEMYFIFWYGHHILDRKHCNIVRRILIYGVQYIITSSNVQPCSDS